MAISGSGTLTNIGPFSQTGNSVFTGNITASANVSSSVTSTASFGTYLGDDRVPPPTYRGKRGGRYTEDKTKDGRPYRRYF